MIKDSKRFAELERLMSDYFACHISPVMKATKDFLGNKQAEEMKEYSTSAAGILNMMATANMPGGDPYQTLRYTGKWNSKTTEDYLAMCKERIVGNKDLQKDFAVMAGEWRKAVIKEIGRERYDALSKQLGCDMAYAYLDHRIEQLMIDKMVKDKMPKSSADYIIRKAAQSSLFGLAYELQKSPLTAEIEARGEAAYKPSKLEKGAGWTLGAAADAVALGGAGSWASFAKFVGIDVALSAVTDKSGKSKSTSPSVEEYLSQGVFGSKKNVFGTFRAEGNKVKTDQSTFIKQTNEQLKKKTPTMSIPTIDWGKTPSKQMPWAVQLPSTGRDDKYKNVPLIVAPGQEEAYLQEMERQKSKPKQTTNSASSPVTENAVASAEIATQETTPQQATPQTQPQADTTNEFGWDKFLGNFGLDGVMGVGKNFGYVLSMLPDVLVGMFTGDTKSISAKNTIMPVASILMGMFIKNPILKMLLIGMGGANLVNKAGKEALNWQAEKDRAQYKQYADEPLNKRISQPMLQGTNLIANIDNVPCTIQLPQQVVDAHQAGALPLNTLANAVLAKHDSMQQMMAQNYNQGEREEVQTIRR